MKKSIKVHPKKRRGRPATGKDPLVSARMPSAVIAGVEAWAEANEVSRSQAFRQLVELGLAHSKSAGYPSAKSAEKAKQLAAKAIEGLVDPQTPMEEAAKRKRRLLKGPEEFREVRADHWKKT
jgi:hypothetical protein